MTARALALLMLAASTPACGSAREEPMSIPDVIANIDALNGRTIQVAGYLGECRGYSCRLFRSPDERAQVEMLERELATRIRRPENAIYPPWLGIGSGERREFDRTAAPFQNRYVLITGRVTNLCRYNGRPGCVDRSTDLEPTGIARWSPPQSAAGNVAQ